MRLQKKSSDRVDLEAIDDSAYLEISQHRLNFLVRFFAFCFVYICECVVISSAYKPVVVSALVHGGFRWMTYRDAKEVFRM